jgi:hypothetical protein
MCKENRNTRFRLNNFFLENLTICEVKVRVKQSHYRPLQTLRVPGG